MFCCFSLTGSSYEVTLPYAKVCPDFTRIFKGIETKGKKVHRSLLNLLASRQLSIKCLKCDRQVK